jgi:hypothetical protein
VSLRLARKTLKVPENFRLRGCLFLLFRSTVVVKIKKTRESTPAWESKANRDKDNILLLPAAPGLSGDLSSICLSGSPRAVTGP